MNPYCAICTSERGPFTEQNLDGRAITVCAACDEPAFERRGPERGYEPNGGLLTYTETVAACAELQKAPAWRRCADLDEEHARTPFRGTGATLPDKPRKEQFRANVRTGKHGRER